MLMCNQLSTKYNLNKFKFHEEICLNFKPLKIVRFKI